MELGIVWGVDSRTVRFYITHHKLQSRQQDRMAAFTRITKFNLYGFMFLPIKLAI